MTANKQLQAEKDVFSRTTQSLEIMCGKLQAELDKHRWIPVSERLPEKTKEDLRPKLLVYNEDGIAVQEWRHYDFGWSFSDDTGEPTHWKPISLPEANP